MVKIETLMNQAGPTAAVYLRAAVDAIDEKFGEGYAAKHPELVGAFMQVCAQDFDTGVRVALKNDTLEIGW